MSAAPVWMVLDDTNQRVVSRHKTIEAAVKAERKFLAAVAKKNGRGSYVHTNIARENVERASCDSAYETAIKMTEAELETYWSALAYGEMAS